MCDSDFSPTSYTTQKKPTKKSESKPPEVLGQMFGTFFLTMVLVLPFSLFWSDPLESLGILIPVFIGVYLVLASIIVERSNVKQAKAEAAAQASAEKTADEATKADTTVEAKKAERTEEVPTDTHFAAAPAQSPEATTVIFDAEATPAKAAALLAATEDEAAARSAHVLLSALATKKLIFLFANDEKSTESIKKALLRLTAKEVFSLLPKNGEHPATDAFTQQYLHHFTAGYTPDTASIDATLINVEQLNKLIEDLPDFSRYLASPFEAESVFVDGKKIYNASAYASYVLKLPASGKLFVLVKPEDIAKIPAEISELAAWLPMDGEQTFGENDIIDSKPVSFDALVQMTESAEKHFYLSEERWKKVDEFSEFLEQTLHFCFDNRKTNAFERFIGLYMAIGHSEAEALDAALAALIIPECFASLIGEEGFDAALRDRLDTAFSLENLPLCTKALECYATVQQ